MEDLTREGGCGVEVWRSESRPAYTAAVSINHGRFSIWRILVTVGEIQRYMTIRGVQQGS